MNPAIRLLIDSVEQNLPEKLMVAQELLDLLASQITPDTTTGTWVIRTADGKIAWVRLYGTLIMAQDSPRYDGLYRDAAWPRDKRKRAVAGKLKDRNAYVT